MFKLAFIYDDFTYLKRDYYLGGSYIFQGEKYACIGNRENAKQFKSKKVAENVYKKIYATCTNVPNKYEIEEV